MPLYQYSSKTKDSRTVKGREYAASEHDLLNALAHRSLTVISLAEIKEEKRRPLIPLAKKKIKILDLTILCKQLATMVKGGVPLIRALESIGSETKNVLLKKTLFEMRDYIHAGDSFSGSIKRFPNVFSTLFIAIVEAGEKVGALDIMLERLSTYLAAWERITKKIKMALTYPAIIVSFFTIALTVVSLVLIPKFKDIYAGFGAKLPTITLLIFNIINFLIHYFIFCLGGEFCGFLGFIVSRLSDTERQIYLRQRPSQDSSFRGGDKEGGHNQIRPDARPLNERRHPCYRGAGPCGKDIGQLYHRRGEP